MALTKKQINDLNKMNKAAQNAKLGYIIENLIENSGGGEGPGSDDGGVIQKSTYLEFPTIGNVKYLYIDTSKNTSYRWDNVNKKYYVVGFDYASVKQISGGNARG